MKIGTTRDIVEGSMEIGGFEVKVKDTAGLRNENQKTDQTMIDEIEKIGMKRALNALHSSQIKVVVVDLTNSRSIEEGRKILDLIARDVDSKKQEKEKEWMARNEIVLIVGNKLDLVVHSTNDSSSVPKINFKELKMEHSSIVINNENDQFMLKTATKQRKIPIHSFFMSCKKEEENGKNLSSSYHHFHQFVSFLSERIKERYSNKKKEDKQNNNGNDIEDEIEEEDVMITRPRHRYHLANISQVSFFFLISTIILYDPFCFCLDLIFFKIEFGVIFTK